MPSPDQVKRRVEDGAKLLDHINDLRKVRSDRRMGLVHDALSSAIDDSVKSAKADGGKVCFTRQQIEVIKDIAFHLVFILDPKNQQKRGFVRALWSDFRTQGPLKQLAIVGSTLSVVIAAIGGIYAGYKEIRSWSVEPPGSAAAATKGINTSGPAFLSWPPTGQPK